MRTIHPHDVYIQKIFLQRDPDRSAYLTQRKQNALEESGRFEERLFERHVKVEIETFVFSDIVTDSWQQDQVEKPEIR